MWLLSANLQVRGPRKWVCLCNCPCCINLCGEFEIDFLFLGQFCLNLSLLFFFFKLKICRWRDVKIHAFDNAKHRTYVDLKVKSTVALMPSHYDVSLFLLVPNKMILFSVLPKWTVKENMDVTLFVKA